MIIEKVARNGIRPVCHHLDERARFKCPGDGFAQCVAQSQAIQRREPCHVDVIDDHAKALGASDVINYRTEPRWGEVAAAQTGVFDRVVNAASGSSLDQSIAALAPGGEIAFMGLFDQATSAPDFIGLMMRGGTIRGTSVGSALAYRDMVAFIDAHGIKPPIARRFALEEVKRLSSGSFGQSVRQDRRRDADCYVDNPEAVLDRNGLP